MKMKYRKKFIFAALVFFVSVLAVSAQIGNRGASGENSTGASGQNGEAVNSDPGEKNLREISPTLSQRLARE